MILVTAATLAEPPEPHDQTETTGGILPFATICELNHPMSEPIVAIGEDECWHLLATTSLGRLVTSISDEPDVFPVNFLVDRRTIVFRTAEGSKLIEVLIQNKVAFEVDEHDNAGGWSVVVKGTAEIVAGDPDLERLTDLHLQSWVPTDKRNYVRITPTTVTGRRVTFGVQPD